MIPKFCSLNQEPLSDLMKLRMLHLYTDFEDGDVLGYFTTFDMGNLATYPFPWALTHCPRLKIIAWDTHDDHVKTEQFFFMRRHTSVRENADYAVALRTTRGRVRDEFPALKLPTFNPKWEDLHHVLIF